MRNETTVTPASTSTAGPRSPPAERAERVRRRDREAPPRANAAGGTISCASSAVGDRRSPASRRARRPRRRRAGTGRRAGCGRRPGTSRPPATASPPTRRREHDTRHAELPDDRLLRRRQRRVDAGTGSRAPTEREDLAEPDVDGADEQPDGQRDEEERRAAQTHTRRETARADDRGARGRGLPRPQGYCASQPRRSPSTRRGRS